MMKLGMLWFDNDMKTPVDERIRKAAAYYQAKHGLVPNRVEVHPSWKEQPGQVDGLDVVPSPYVLPNHCWVGVVHA